MHSSQYNNNRPIYRPTVTRVRIAHEGPGMSSDSSGIIDLYPSASKLFGVLDQNNVFTGTDNVFQHIQARQMHFISDPLAKENVKRIVSGDAIALVRCIEPYTYTICNSGTSAGFMADMIPPEYTRLTPGGLQTVDYNAMFTHLWAAVQHLDTEVTHLKQCVHTEKRNTVKPCPTPTTSVRRRASL